MLHQPFEAWILDPSGLTPQDRQSLHVHLETCPRCRELSGQWHGAERQLSQPVMVGPTPGFVQRWQARLASSRTRNLFTLRRVTPVLVIAMVVVAFALAVQYFTNHSFIDLINEISRGLIWFSAQLQGILQAANDWLSDPLGHLPLAAIVFVALVIALVWLTVLWRILRKGEITQ
ncbi:MAG TPA: zf-HC2 domain-containing protein [Anaerolineaceae bacterium]|nr:zf-HC2 domain-containing protein [Anaerolineaceae bacterium]